MEHLSEVQTAQIEEACCYMRKLLDVTGCPVTITAFTDGSVDALVQMGNGDSCSISVKDETVIRRYIRREKHDA